MGTHREKRRDRKPASIPRRKCSVHVWLPGRELQRVLLRASQVDGRKSKHSGFHAESQKGLQGRGGGAGPGSRAQPRPARTWLTPHSLTHTQLGSRRSQAQAPEEEQGHSVSPELQSHSLKSKTGLFPRFFIRSKKPAPLFLCSVLISHSSLGQQRAVHTTGYRRLQARQGCWGNLPAKAGPAHGTL